MATKSATIENKEEARVSIMLPLLDEESSGHVDQTINVERNGEIVRFKRGERVDVPVWVFEIMKQSGKFDTI